MERIALLLAEGLKSLGDDVSLAIIGPPIEYSDYPQSLGGAIRMLRAGQKPYFWTALPGHVSRLREHVRRWKPDVCLSIGGQALIVSRLAGVRSHVYAAQNSDGIHWHGSRPGHVLLRILERWALKQGDLRVVACSESVRSAYRERFRIKDERIGVISNASNLRLFEARYGRRTVGPLRILMVGTLYFQKNYEMALRSFRLVLAKRTSAELWIAGDGPDRARLEREARELGVQGQTRFLGSRSDVQELMKESDIFWLTSRYEGMGLVLAEAMAARRPIIATDVPGIRDAITDGENGFLVGLDDDGGLAERTDWVLVHPDDAMRMCEVGYRRAFQEHSPDVMCKAYRGVFEEVLVSGRRS